MDSSRTNVVIIIVSVLVIAGAGIGIIILLTTPDAEIAYEYDLYRETSYLDADGRHYPSSGNVFIWAEIHQINVGEENVLALPNCYSLRDQDGKIYSWVTGWTDDEQLSPNSSTDIITIFEVPKSFQKGIIMWNMDSVKATCINS